jgi:hypothetical protein
MIGDQTPVQRAEFGNEMVAYASELGIGRDQLVSLFQNEPIMRHSAFQRMIHDAVRARMTQKAANAASKAIPRDLPPVQRPGTAQHRSGSDASGKIQNLEKQFASAKGNKAVQIMADIVAAERRAKRG